MYGVRIMSNPLELRIPVGPIVQIGFVVRDAEAYARRWTTLFDFPPPRIVEWPLREGMTAVFRGAPIDLKMKIAFVETGSVQLEFIQPLEPNNLYAEFLEQHGEGMHHVMFDVADPEAIADQLGVGVLQSGDTVKPGGRWFYLDTQSLLGLPLELRRPAP
jgi:hypothetical protein